MLDNVYDIRGNLIMLNHRFDSFFNDVSENMKDISSTGNIKTLMSYILRQDNKPGNEEKYRYDSLVAHSRHVNGIGFH